MSERNPHESLNTLAFRCCIFRQIDSARDYGCRAGPLLLTKHEMSLGSQERVAGMQPTFKQVPPSSCLSTRAVFKPSGRADLSDVTPESRANDNNVKFSISISHAAGVEQSSRQAASTAAL